MMGPIQDNPILHTIKTLNPISDLIRPRRQLREDIILNCRAIGQMVGMSEYRNTVMQTLEGFLCVVRVYCDDSTGVR